MGVAQLFVGRVVGSGIVFLNASIANDKSILASFGDEVFQSAFELRRPFACRINVGNANSLVGLREGTIVLPHLLLLLQRGDDVGRELERQGDEVGHRGAHRGVE